MGAECPAGHSDMPGAMGEPCGSRGSGLMAWDRFDTVSAQASEGAQGSGSDCQGLERWASCGVACQVAHGFLITPELTDKPIRGGREDRGTALSMGFYSPGRQAAVDEGGGVAGQGRMGSGAFSWSPWEPCLHSPWHSVTMTACGPAGPSPFCPGRLSCTLTR